MALFCAFAYKNGCFFAHNKGSTVCERYVEPLYNLTGARVNSLRRFSHGGHRFLKRKNSRLQKENPFTPVMVIPYAYMSFSFFIKVLLQNVIWFVKRNLP